ncbi:rubrerythrin family protein [Clostridium sp.]|uniref:rubrerythrin family protein n=1 Tax=Clostridium sp. TaxID=1506 RepID=UPI002FC5DFCE
MALEGSQTEVNLKKTFASEARAVTRYQLFAENARTEGYEFIARVFEETASQNLAQARQVYGRFLGRIESLQENLKSSADLENAELNVYLDYERIATEEGLTDIANFYREARVVTDLHYRQFNDIYTRLANGTLYSRNVIQIWQCMNCGYLHEGKEAPTFCPLCFFPQGWYKLLRPDY